MVANLARTDWRSGARWMHYNLLDGDLACNTLSWQWIVGTFSKKPYLANQQNINRFSSTEQMNTEIDMSYETLSQLEVPSFLTAHSDWTYSAWDPNCLHNDFPQFDAASMQNTDTRTTLYLHSIYNLNPQWHAALGRHVLVIEPDQLAKNPVSPLRGRFITHCAQLIPDLEVFIGSPVRLLADCANDANIIFQEHPLCNHWPGQRQPRPWLFESLEGDCPSFFKFWRTAIKSVKQQGTKEFFLSLDDTDHGISANTIASNSPR